MTGLGPCSASPSQLNLPPDPTNQVTNHNFVLRPSGKFFLYYTICSYIVLSYLILSCLIFSFLLQSFRLSCYVILYYITVYYITLHSSTLIQKQCGPRPLHVQKKPLIETVGCHSPGKPTRSNMFFQKCKGGRRKGAAHLIFSSEADTQKPNIHPENPQAPGATARARPQASGRAQRSPRRSIRPAGQGMRTPRLLWRAVDPRDAEPAGHMGRVTTTRSGAQKKHRSPRCSIWPAGQGHARARSAKAFGTECQSLPRAALGA